MNQTGQACQREKRAVGSYFLEFSKYNINCFLLWKEKTTHVLKIQGLLDHGTQIQIFILDLPAVYKAFTIWCMWEDLAPSVKQFQESLHFIFL